AGPCELFMVKRHGKSAFMANAYVYPGGRLDDADCSEALARHATGRDGLECAQLLQEEIEPALARGLFLAGIRESFEEAGVLLAHPLDEPHRCLLDDAATRALHTWRDALNARTTNLLEVATAANLGFPLDRLFPFAHWITPEIEPKRYDTRFLVALCP